MNLNPTQPRPARVRTQPSCGSAAVHAGVGVREAVSEDAVDLVPALRRLDATVGDQEVDDVTPAGRTDVAVDDQEVGGRDTGCTAGRRSRRPGGGRAAATSRRRTRRPRSPARGITGDSDGSPGINWDH